MADTLASCLAQPGIVAENVVVVDDGSRDGTTRIAAEFGVQLLRMGGQGPGAARNAGLDWALSEPPEYLLLVDADVVLPPDWLARALAHLSQLGPKAAAVGGTGISGGDSASERLLDGGLWGWDPSPTMPMEVRSLATMDVLLRTAAIFDRRFVTCLIAGEDPEICFRMRADGWTLWTCADLAVTHVHPATVCQLIRRWFRYGQYYLYPYLLHPEEIGFGVVVRASLMPGLAAMLLASATLRRGRIGYAVACAVLGVTALGTVFFGREYRRSRAEDRTFDSRIPVLGVVRTAAHSSGIWYGMLRRPRLLSKCIEELRQGLL
jgi:glycosyltransferase involved in cell wall biosynthesis